MLFNIRALFCLVPASFLMIVKVILTKVKFDWWTVMLDEHGELMHGARIAFDWFRVNTGIDSAQFDCLH